MVNGFQAALGTANGNGFVARIDTTQSGTSSLVYSTYIGGGGNTSNWLGDVALDVAVDSSGYAYVTGQTGSDGSTTPFPTTSGAYQSTLASTYGNAFLTVVDTNSTGATSLVYSTYLGGVSTLFGDYGEGVAVDNFGDAFITGQTSSGSSEPFPLTSSAFQSTLNSQYGNAFVTEIATTQSGAQSLVYSTYLGGSSSSIVGDSGSHLALDPSGAVYVAGDATSFDFPVTSGAFQTTNSSGGRAFVAKMDLTKSGAQSLVYSTYLGGTDGPDGEVANGLAVDPSGDAFVTGNTSSSDFPTTSGAYQTTKSSSFWNMYLTEINPSGAALLYSTFLGGSCSTSFGGVAYGVALDSLGNAYVDGSSCSSNFPVQPSNAYQTSLAGAQNATVTKFAFVQTPGITAIPSPQPNAAGWNNFAVTVSFICIPGGAPLASCSSPAALTTEGANQTVTGTVIDTSSNSATASATVNLDLTPPTLSVSSPANNSTVTTPYVAIAGTASDALSGLAGVACNGISASLNGSAFSCTAPLFSVSNSVVVSATDIAGNVSTSTLSVTVSMSAPTALTVTPGPISMLIGQQQSFTAVDQTGTRRPDATWSVSDSTIASFVSGSPNTLLGVAAGQVTLTATVGSVSGQTTVTVPSGTSLPAGTMLWSATPFLDYVAQKIVQAVPTAGGPDLYSIEEGSEPGLLVRAFQSDGTQLWQSVAGSSYTNGLGFTNALGDNSGGVLLLGTAYGASSDTAVVLDFDPVKGSQKWAYSATGSFVSDAAVGPDGTVYIVEQVLTTLSTGEGESYGYLDAISASTGSLVSQTQLPYSTFEMNCLDYQQPYIQYTAGLHGSPMVGPDGSVHLEVESRQYVQDGGCELDPHATYSYSEVLSLLQIPPGGSAQLQTLNSYSATDGSAPYSTPGDVIPDGQGGVLASWLKVVPGSADQYGPYPLTIADVGPQGVSQADISSLAFYADPDPFGNVFNLPDDNLVLGDNNTAFVTDGATVVAFNPSTLQTTWTYSSTGGGLSFVAATGGAGVAINDSQQGVIQLDPSGNPSQVIGQSGNPPSFSWSDQWYLLSAAGTGLSQIAMPLAADGASLWATPVGDPSGSRATYPLDSTLVQSTLDPPGPTCPICNLRSPACSTFAGSGSTYLILVGDPGINTTTGSHNVGNLFNLAAQTEANNLQAGGHHVVACRISSVQHTSTALTTHGLIDGGVIYFGHSGLSPGTDINGNKIYYSILAPGQQSGASTNISYQNVGSLSNAQLGSGAEFAITLNGCNAGARTPSGLPPIALLLANQLQRTVAAYKVGMHFSNLDASHDPTVVGPSSNPSGLPMYMNADGAPPRPQPTYFYPPH